MTEGYWPLSLFDQIAPGVSQNQIRGWLATHGTPLYIYSVDNAVSADIANAVNIQWLHSNSMVIGDPLYLFIQSTLGFSGSTMSAVYSAMLLLAR